MMQCMISHTDVAPMKAAKWLFGRKSNLGKPNLMIAGVTGIASSYTAWWFAYHSTRLVPLHHALHVLPVWVQFRHSRD